MTTAVGWGYTADAQPAPLNTPASHSTWTSMVRSVLLPSRPVFAVRVPQVEGVCPGWESATLAFVAGPSGLVNVESHSVFPEKQSTGS